VKEDTDDKVVSKQVTVNEERKEDISKVKENSKDLITKRKA